VIGVPLDNPPLGGLDALLSTVQMPGGVPVAAVAVGGGGPQNAALFALRILALGSPEIAKRLAQHRSDMARKVAQKDAALQERLRG
jgi:phosphoribosylaminoimidazole carboxylase PurE protein